MSIVLQSSGGGQVTLSEPSVASNVTCILPSSNTQLFCGPAFSAYLGATSQALSSQTITKVQMSTEVFDTNNNYDTTNYRFTPTVAGYYYITACIQYNVSSAVVYIYKNGAVHKAMNGMASSICSALIYFNGTTDYVEAYAWLVSAGSVTGGTQTTWSYFDGHLVRAA